MNPLTQAAIARNNAEDSKFVKFCIYAFIAIVVVAFAMAAVDHLAK